MKEFAMQAEDERRHADQYKEQVDSVCVSRGRYMRVTQHQELDGSSFRVPHKSFRCETKCLISDLMACYSNLHTHAHVHAQTGEGIVSQTFSVIRLHRHNICSVSSPVNLMKGHSLASLTWLSCVYLSGGQGQRSCQGTETTAG